MAPNMNGTTITGPADLSTGGPQKLKQPRKGVAKNFIASGGGKELSGGYSTGHDTSLTRSARNVKRLGQESPAERIGRLSKK